MYACLLALARKRHQITNMAYKPGFLGHISNKNLIILHRHAATFAPSPSRTKYLLALLCFFFACPLLSPGLLEHSINPSSDDRCSVFELSAASSKANPQIATIFINYNFGVFGQDLYNVPIRTLKPTSIKRRNRLLWLILCSSIIIVQYTICIYRSSINVIDLV